MLRKNLVLAVLVGMLGLVIVCVNGCAVGPARLEADYGTSFELSKFNQILDPETEKNLKPVVGIDGQAAEIIIEEYRESFEGPAVPPTKGIVNIITR